MKYINSNGTLYTPEEFDTITAAALQGAPDKRVMQFRNAYGNFEHKRALPEGMTHLSGDGCKLAGACKALGIYYLRFVAGFTNSGSKRKPHWHPDYDGIVVSFQDAARIKAYWAGRDDQEKRWAAWWAEIEAVYNHDEPENEL